MKKNILTLALTLVFGFSATATTPIDGETKKVDIEKSNVAWKAYKVTGSHNGVLSLTSGSLSFDEGKLTGGEFVVNMTTLSTTDLEGKSKSSLDGHLKSDDFFSTEKHPTSTLTFSTIKSTGKNSYDVKGTLTIKGISKEINLVISVYGSKATATMKVDRTLYDIKYKSGNFFENLGDKTIYDEFDMVVDLVF
ncbi:MAG: YceI family protein [Cellulophaga sp.]